MKYKAVIYDCDGVMFDSFEANLLFYDRIMEKLGNPPLDRGDTELMHILHTRASHDVLRHIFSDEEAWNTAVRCIPAVDYSELIPFMHMEEGLRETLEFLAPQIELAVCTNRAKTMAMVLEHFDLARYFGVVITALRVINPKPHPEPLLKVLEHYGIGPGEALFVGDSEVDRQAALAAGVPFVAYKAELPAFARIKRHSEILDLLSLSIAC